MFIRLFQSYPCLGDKSPPCYHWQTGDESCPCAWGLLREFCRLTISTKRLPDSGALGLRICQANPSSTCSSNCVQRFHFYFGKSASGECVSH